MTKKPTTRDLKIYEYLKNGNTINHLTAIDKFNCIGLRDAVYRLSKAGYDIQREDVNYQLNGQRKVYRKYFIDSKNVA